MIFKGIVELPEPLPADLIEECRRHKAAGDEIALDHTIRAWVAMNFRGRAQPT
jgi:hypothetical protein